MMKEKILIIRFSSFGDIVQCMGAIDSIKKKFPQSSLSWVVRSDFLELLSLNKNVDHIYPLYRSQGLLGLLKLARTLRREHFDFIYDAHRNTRSLILKILLFSLRFPLFVTRRKERIKRFLFFKFRINFLPTPFIGRKSYLFPLKKFGVSQKIIQQKWAFSKETQIKVRKIFSDEGDFYCLVPAAAWDLKMWPIESWIELIKIYKNEKFLILGGPDDHFCERLVDVSSDRVINLAGKLSLIESCYILGISKGFVSGDTGLLHVADLLGVPGFALIGPSAFGYPASEKIKVLKSNLKCMPCTKDGSGKCSQQVYKQCMKEIHPKDIIFDF